MFSVLLVKLSLIATMKGVLFFKLYFWVNYCWYREVLLIKKILKHFKTQNNLHK